MTMQIEKIMVAADHEARGAAIVIHYNGETLELRLSGGSLESFVQALQKVARELGDKH